VKPTTLLRLYPRLWRMRYGSEFLAMLESTPPSRRRTVDVVRAAAWEWLRWTRTGRIIIAVIVAAPVTALALLLAQAWPVSPWQTLPAAHTWTRFWLVMGLGSFPLVAGTVLLFDAALSLNRRQRFGFRSQLLMLSMVTVLAHWWSAVLLPESANQLFVFPGVLPGLEPWFGNAGFLGFFLILLFNIEAGSRWRQRLSLDA